MYVCVSAYLSAHLPLSLTRCMSVVDLPLSFDLYSLSFSLPLSVPLSPYYSLFILLFTGVPITTQWDSKGYHYPIQVAQYGLSHHAKHLINGEPEALVLEDAQSSDLSRWIMPDRKSKVNVATDPETEMQVMEFVTSG